MTHPWRTTLLAGSASYLDAGSIVAGAVGLPLWTEHFGFGTSFVGLIGAFSSNAISAGVGALVGGWLCDKLGRRRVYQWDLLLYAFGLLWIIFATEPWMLVFGYVFTGLAVGVDVPASWTLIAEAAPKGKHGRHGGLAQVLWLTGPLVVLLMGLALSGTGLLGVRLIFAHLLVLSLADLVPQTQARRVTAVGGAGAARAHHARELQAADEQAVRHPARDADRDVRPVEPARRHERLLPPVHPHDDRRPDAGGERRPQRVPVRARRAERAAGVHAARRPRPPHAAVRHRRPLADRGRPAARALPAHDGRRVRLRADERSLQRVRPAAVLPALERRGLPDVAARHRARPDVRDRADRARRLEPRPPDVPGGRLPRRRLDADRLPQR